MKSENPALMRSGSRPLDHVPDGLPLPESTGPIHDDAVAMPDTISAPRPATFVGRVVAHLLYILRIRRTSHALLRLSDAELKDIGLARCQVYGDFDRYRRAQSHALERRSRH